MNWKEIVGLSNNMAALRHIRQVGTGFAVSLDVTSYSLSGGREKKKAEDLSSERL